MKNKLLSGRYLAKPQRASSFAALLTSLSLIFSGAVYAQDKPFIATFDGNSSPTFAANSALDIIGYGAIELWLQPQLNVAEQDQAVLAYSGEQGPRFAVVVTRDKKAIGIYSGQDWATTDIKYSPDKLTHVAFNFLEQYTDVYVNGEFQATIGAGITDVPASHLHLGSINGADMAYKGKLGGIRIWDTPLDPDHIELYRKSDIFSENGAQHPKIESLIAISRKAGESLSMALPFADLSEDLTGNAGDDEDELLSDEKLTLDLETELKKEATQ